VKTTLIIAEAGVNHNGSIELAKQLIDVASDAGADIVKFQTFKAEKIVSKTAKKASYQLANTGNNESQYDMLKKLELNHEQHVELIRYCTSKNIEFLSTPFDEESIRLLEMLGVRIGKIPSGEITNLPYLKKMAASFGQLILSTGMSTLDEIREAVQVFTSSGVFRENITVLHCNTEYPTPVEDVNLNAMQTIAKNLSVKVGYSDHTPGIEVPIAAVALGAVIIEKHFTLDRNMEGPDHKASLEPDELKSMVRYIRNIEQAMGKAIKEPTPSEIKNRVIVRKSIVAAKHISEGEIFPEVNLSAQRRGSGISPMKWNQLIGKPARRNYEPDELIEP